MTISQVYDKKTKPKNKQNSQAHKFATPAVLSKILIKNRRWKREREKKKKNAFRHQFGARWPREGHM